MSKTGSYHHRIQLLSGDMKVYLIWFPSNFERIFFTFEYLISRSQVLNLQFSSYSVFISNINNLLSTNVGRIRKNKHNTFRSICILTWEKSLELHFFDQCHFMKQIYPSEPNFLAERLIPITDTISSDFTARIILQVLYL